MTTGVLLINLGTPRSFKPRDVKRYLTQFLTDERVIDIPFLARQLLVRALIVPKRYRESARLYQTIWMEEGSPLLVYGRRTQKQLQERLGERFQVRLAMRYQTPSIKEGVSALARCEHVIVLPLFPHYASATTGSVFQEVFYCFSRLLRIPSLHFISDYYDHPHFIEAWAERGREKEWERFDHILFSYHGLPEKQVRRSDSTGRCLRSAHCCQTNRLCYSGQCVATTQLITQKLGIPKERFSHCYQSRLGRAPWLKPYTSDALAALAKQGKKRLLVFSPAFVCDCLETLEEIGVQYQEEFKELGGEKLELVSGLNDHPKWMDALEELVRPLARG